jgi:hypothetical protein
MRNPIFQVLLKENGLIAEFSFLESFENMSIVLACAQTLPTETAKALGHAFNSKSDEELTKYSEGRGTMVQVLEFLCQKKILLKLLFHFILDW